MPVTLRLVFDETDIERMWDFLEKIFHLNKKSWKAYFETTYAKSPKHDSKVETFMKFAIAYLELPISVLLYRKKEGTWFTICEHVLKDKLEAKRNEPNSQNIHTQKH